MSCNASNLPGGRDPVRREAVGAARGHTAHGAQLIFRGNVSLSSACSNSAAKIVSNIRLGRRRRAGDDLGGRLGSRPLGHQVFGGHPGPACRSTPGALRRGTPPAETQDSSRPRMVPPSCRHRRRLRLPGVPGVCWLAALLVFGSVACAAVTPASLNASRTRRINPVICTLELRQIHRHHGSDARSEPRHLTLAARARQTPAASAPQCPCHPAGHSAQPRFDVKPRTAQAREAAAAAGRDTGAGRPSAAVSEGSSGIMPNAFPRRIRRCPARPGTGPFTWRRDTVLGGGGSPGQDDAISGLRVLDRNHRGPVGGPERCRQNGRHGLGPCG